MPTRNFLIATLVFLFAGHTFAEEFSTQELRRSLDADERLERAPERATHALIGSAYLAMGYVRGVSDAMSVMSHCIPSNDYLCQVALRREIFFLWRPFLKDPKDDLVLELAVESECEFIITYNRRDFAGTEKFGIKVLTPKEFLKTLGEIT